MGLVAPVPFGVESVLEYFTDGDILAANIFSMLQLDKNRGFHHRVGA
jgi:hypothetical protein